MSVRTHREQAGGIVNTTAELKALEERAYKRTWEDGVLDIIIGAGLTLLGVLFRTELAGLAGMFVAVLMMPLWALGKKLITVPRLGYVEFGAERKARERGWTKQLLVLGTMTFVLAVGLYVAIRSDGGVAESLADLRIGYLLMGVLIALGLAVAGMMIGTGRFVGYAGIVLTATGVGYVTGVELEDYLLAAGLVILACGFVVLARFLHRYPVTREGGR
ncbi:MAG: hypothetical protein OEU54_05745 [Gemmatimonadota bacterium]|nr:hypothetical protein [Gemmatimonadota bacterium]